MKLKLIEIEGKQYAEVQDGKPVYEDDDGKELAFDAVGTRQTISRLNAEAKSHRERAEAAERAAKSFDGIDDPEAARAALKTVQNLDQKKLIDAGEVERVRSEIAKSYEAKLEAEITSRTKLEQQLYDEKIGGNFARSKFATERLAIPADMVQARFGTQFKVEEGRVVAYDSNGNKLYSKSNPGELANFDEALELLVDQYPYKDHILKAPAGSGGDAQGGTSRGNGQSRHYDPSKLAGTPEERKKAIAARFPELQE
jgi:hypothetical protein